MAVATYAFDFVSVMHLFLRLPMHDPKYVVNMDQMTVYFSIYEKKMTEKKVS